MLSDDEILASVLRRFIDETYTAVSHWGDGKSEDFVIDGRIDLTSDEYEVVRRAHHA